MNVPENAAGLNGFAIRAAGMRFISDTGKGKK